MKKLIIYIILLGFTIMISGQDYGHGHMDPDSLNKITVTGTVIVDETIMQHTYYLDEDTDGKADYHLNFGPYWYNPDSSAAIRPLNGEDITVSGAVHDSYNMSELTIIVYEINGEFWRDPYFAEWNNLGNHSHQLGGHHGGMMVYGFGWEHDTLVTKEIIGTAVVDTTFYMNHYYLDVNNDSEPDYFLNLGPYWYESETGVVRPLNGEKITILGGLITTSMNLPMIIVYEINGNEWRDSSTIGNHFGGGWFHAELSDSQTFHAPFDVHDQMTIREGWNGHGGQGQMGGMDNFDSLFCQILEVYPKNIPNLQEMDNVFAGYVIQMFDPSGSSWMRNDGMMGGYMQFGSDVRYQMHYSDKQLIPSEAEENSIHAKYWDVQTNNWIEINSSLNTESNTITFESNIVSNFVVLEFSKVTSVKNINTELTPIIFSLAQNYPNPFNPRTTIKYSFSKTSKVTLAVYDILGSEVATLVNKEQPEGNYEVEFVGSELPSGIYFYRLQVYSAESGAGDFVETKKMILLK